MNMRFGHCDIFVSDPLQSKEFYVDVLGFEVVDIQGEGAFVWLKLGDYLVLLRPGKNPPTAPDYGDSATALCLYTDNFAQTVDRLQSLNVVKQSSETSSDCCTLVDPDGNWIQIVDPRAFS